MNEMITITAEYLPGPMNVEADWESRHTKDSSRVGSPQIDLFASRLSNQIPA